MSDAGTTFMTQHGIQKRMRCSGQMASRIEETFVTVGQLVDAVESGKELTDYDGIGPKTAETIEDWWENRFEREEKVGSGSFERTGARTATVRILHSWDEAIGADEDSELVTDGGEVQGSATDIPRSYRSSDRYEPCEECGGRVDTYEPGHYKTADERFKHQLCHEEGEVPEQYELVEDYPDECHTNRQYVCGHTLHAPQTRQPMVCPVCNNIDVEVTKIEQ